MTFPGGVLQYASPFATIMPSTPTPQAPLYRITLFYGPEPVKGRPSCLSCVFNVKKRSWKGGVQVAVEVGESQLGRARRAVGFEGWLKGVLADLSEDERPYYESRAGDLLVQAVCAMKLDLAIEGGLRQENASIGNETLVGELDQAVPAQADRIRTAILTELDLTGT